MFPVVPEYSRGGGRPGPPPAPHGALPSAEPPPRRHPSTARAAHARQAAARATILAASRLRRPGARRRGAPGSISLIARVGNNSPSPAPPFGPALPLGARAGQSPRGLAVLAPVLPGAGGSSGRARRGWRPPALLLLLPLKWPRCRLFKLAVPERRISRRCQRAGRAQWPRMPGVRGGGGEPRTGLGPGWERLRHRDRSGGVSGPGREREPQSKPGAGVFSAV